MDENKVPVNRVSTTLNSRRLRVERSDALDLLHESRKQSKFIIEKSSNQVTAQGYTIIGITNQGGCDTINRDTGKPLKSIEDAIAEQHYTLELIPQLEAIYFCPDMKGFICYRVTRNGAVKVAYYTLDSKFLEDKFKFRKPGAGMIFRASIDFDLDLTKSWMIGDRRMRKPQQQ
ncbi:hypothetical protein [Nostoc sp. WHI]|uniref:hypothetical protein n=1 Tax=Nostoc sp. WHI TaxID=2650611 RepID=UPI001E2BC897|nr:hypothetical protein [Nostoc sp. WHI]